MTPAWALVWFALGLALGAFVLGLVGEYREIWRQWCILRDDDAATRERGY